MEEKNQGKLRRATVSVSEREKNLKAYGIKAAENIINGCDAVLSSSIRLGRTSGDGKLNANRLRGC